MNGAAHLIGFFRLKPTRCRCESAEFSVNFPTPAGDFSMPRFACDTGGFARRLKRFGLRNFHQFPRVIF
jgi:hypothetical protein